jgi:transposase
MSKVKKSMGVQQILLSPDNETKAILEYLCQQSGKLYNNGVYFARQTFFKTGRMLISKFDLIYEESVSKSLLAQSMPSNIDYSKVKEFTILPKNGAFYLEMSYEIEKQKHELDINQALSIDLGTADNIAACVDTFGNSLLIDARAMKAMNQLWNKKVSTRKEGKPEAYWDNWLDRVTRKRNHQMRDGINKTAKLIIDHCLKHGIGILVIGWNEGFKSNANMGRLNNHSFCSNASR